MLKTGPNRPLMHKIQDKLDECEEIMSEFVIDSATDDGDTNSPINVTHQESNEGMVNLSKTKKGIMRSKMVIDKINDMKMTLGSKITLRKTGKTNMDSEPLTNLCQLS